MWGCDEVREAAQLPAHSEGSAGAVALLFSGQGKDRGHLGKDRSLSHWALLAAGLVWSQVLEGLEIWLSLPFYPSPSTSLTFPLSLFIFWMQFNLVSRTLEKITSAQDAPCLETPPFSLFRCLVI